MALIKEEIQINGATARYWIISNISISKLSNTATIQLLGYPDRETRLEFPKQGKVKRRTINVPTEDFQVLYGRVVQGGANLLVQLYRYIRGVEKGTEGGVYWSTGGEDGEEELSWFADAESDHKDISN